jgi:hypothetical protein
MPCRVRHGRQAIGSVRHGRSRGTRLHNVMHDRSRLSRDRGPEGFASASSSRGAPPSWRRRQWATYHNHVQARDSDRTYAHAVPQYPFSTSRRSWIRAGFATSAVAVMVPWPFVLEPRGTATHGLTVPPRGVSDNVFQHMAPAARRPTMRSASPRTTRADCSGITLTGTERPISRCAQGWRAR